MENVELLKGVLSEETYNKVVEESKKSNIRLFDMSSGEYVSKSKYDALDIQLKSTQDLLDAKTKDYDTLKSKAGDNQSLKDEIDRLKSAHTTETENLKKDYEAKIKKSRIAAQIIQEYKPKDVNDVLAHIDIEKISVDGDNLVGLKEQVDPLKETKAYYFAEETKPGASGVQHGGSDNSDYSAVRAAMGLKND